MQTLPPAEGRAVITHTPAGRPDRRTRALALPDGQPDPPAGVTDSQLAVVLRQTQWALDEAAHDFPAGRVTPQRREELAGTLEALAAIVRASVPGSGVGGVAQ